MPQTTYCTAAELTFVLSDVGVESRVDDDESGVASVAETAHIATAISWAAAEINTYIPKRYYPLSSVSSNVWLVMANALLAAEWLCQRRGNVAMGDISRRCSEIRTKLEMIRFGRMPLPEQAETTENTPTVSNFSVVPGSLSGPIVVNSRTSTGSAPVGGIQQFTSYYLGYW